MVSLNSIKRQLHRRDGLAVVEMAIVLPLLILLTFGMIEYGWLFLRSQEISNAARQGARIGVWPDWPTPLRLASFSRCPTYYSSSSLVEVEETPN